MQDQVSTYNRTEGTVPTPAALRRISWGAILAGVAVALSIQILLNVLGIGIGASTIDIRQGDTPGSGLAIGAGIWFAVSALISLYFGGWAAGRLAGVPNSKDGMLHGFTTWSITTIAAIFLLSSAAGGLVGGAASLLDKTASVTGQAAQSASPTLTTMVSKATGVTPSEVKQQAGDVTTDPRFQTFATQIITQGTVSPEARTNLVSLVSDKQGVTQEQANAEVAAWEQKLQQAKSTAVTAADKTASGVSKAALWSFAALLLGAMAATFGGMAGSPKFSFRLNRISETVLPEPVRS